MRKICLLGEDFFRIGGVSRVSTVLANAFSESYLVTIIDISGDKVDKNLYGMSDAVKIIDGSCRTGFWNKHRSTYRVLNKIFCVLPIWRMHFFSFCYSFFYYSLKQRKRTLSIIEREGFDVVIGVQGYCSCLLALVAKKTKSYCIGWQHNSFDAYFRLKNRYFWHQDLIFKDNLRNLDRYVLLTECDTKKTNEYFNLSNCVCIHNPKSFSSSVKSELKKCSFVFVGRFDIMHKGLDMLLKSYKLYLANGGQWKLRLVGDGKDSEILKVIISELDLMEKVEMVPYTSNVKQVFEDNSILLLSSRWEGQPMAALESLEMGVPIIAYDISAMREIITNGREGLLVPRNDVIEFARQMKVLSDDEKMRNRMSKNCILRANDFSLKNILVDWKNLFDEVVNEKQG